MRRRALAPLLTALLLRRNNAVVSAAVDVGSPFDATVAVELKRVLVIQGAMPSAVFNIMIARHYGGHAPTAVQCVLATTVVSLVTTPLVLAWALRLTGVGS